MKTTLFRVVLCGCAAVLAPAADNASVTGRWQVHTSISGNESDQLCTFTQKDDALGGTCAGERGTFELSGKVDGNKVTWSYKSEYNGTPLTVIYEGALGPATTIKGSVNVPEFAAAGDFMATPAK